MIPFTYSLFPVLPRADNILVFDIMKKTDTAFAVSD
jgi:hypothetical protein